MLLACLLALESLGHILLANVPQWDGMQYFYLQYFFINHLVTTGEIAHWIPYLTHGVVAYPMWALQAGLFSNSLSVLGPLAGLLKTTNFVVLFHLGIFADRFLLLVGSWLLGRRLFSSPLAVFISSFTILASSVWYTQVWFNFHFYCALPMVLAMGHRFLDRARWRYFFLSANLLALQTMGNLPYQIPVSSLLVGLYFGLFLVFNPSAGRRFRRHARIGLPAVAAICGALLSLAAAYGVLRLESGSLIHYNLGRSQEGTVALEEFLTFGRNLHAYKWIELLLGLSPYLDMTLYIGLLPLCLSLVALTVGLRHDNLHVPVLGGVMLLFSLGTVVAVVFFHTWPFMNYYRHLAFISPLVRFLLCLLTGFGIEVLTRPRDRPALRVRGVLVAVAVLLAATGILLHTLANRPDLQRRVIDPIVEPGIYVKDPSIGQTFYWPGLKAHLPAESVETRLRLGGFAAMAMALGIGLIAAANRHRVRFAALAVCVTLHCLQLMHYHWWEAQNRTRRLTEAGIAAARFSPLPYNPTRSPAGATPNDRRAMITDEIYKPNYWTVNMALFREELWADLRTESWLAPFDQYLLAYCGQDVVNPGGRPCALDPSNRLRFPDRHPAAARIAGISDLKIRFASTVFFTDDIRQLAGKITAPGYRGDSFHLLAESGTSETTGAASGNRRVDALPDAPPGVTSRLRRFNANRLEMLVRVPGTEPVWMLWADVWHPAWRAEVNGRSRTVWRANLAYKAVRLEPGDNRVRFTFRPAPMVWLLRLWGVCAALWIGGLLGAAGTIVAGKSQGAPVSRAGQGDRVGCFPETGPQS